MGNAVTASILLDNDGGAHVAGTTLTGRIHVVIHRKIPGKQIILLVKGKEKTSIYRKEKRRYSSRDIFRARIVMNDLAEKPQVSQGSYSFPFSIDLPDSLPSSFSYQDRKNSCSIQYKCVASVGAATTHRYFIVRSSPLQNVRVPCFLEPKTQEIMAMGFQSKGSITFGVSVDDIDVGKGQELIFSVACVNDTCVEIEHVNVKVVELVTFQVGTWAESRKNVLANMTELNLPGLVTRRKSKEQVREDKRGGLDFLREANYSHIYEELSSGRNTIRIRIPASANDTYAGSLISVSHYVKLYLKTPKMVMNIEQKIPLRIGFPPEVQEAARVDLQRPVQPSAAAPTRTGGVVPFANAVPLPSSNIEALVATAPAEAIILGGVATSSYDMGVSSTDFDVVPLPPPQVPTLSLLLDEMTSSVNDIDIISSKLNSPDWRPVIVGMTPVDYGAVIAHVNMDFDQPRVAAMLAPRMNQGNGGFTCAYCRSAIQNAAQWNRIAMVQKLLPLCVDIQTGFPMLQEELTQWELTVTSQDFQQVLDHSERR